MSDYKQFCGIARNDQGIIERTGERTFLGKRGIPGVLNATAEYRVVRVEPGDVAGWGDAIAIGNVELLIDGRAQRLSVFGPAVSVSRLLVEAGEALYGPRWQAELARDLGVSIRTMQRWASGSHDTPRGLNVDLLRLTQERAAVLDALAPRLSEV